ncbi:MAG: hypothetical protein HY268_18500 [Deltaproteobacteria bacterium]|nr:hypothetical protein [Deltaproteobacteria bacterium]
MAEHVLPETFRDLEPFAGWALATEKERNQKRLASTMAEIQSFYDAILPRMEAVIAYLNQFPLDAMPADAQRLLSLTFSLAEVSTAVELFKQPGVIDGYDATRFVPVHK